MKSSTTAKHKKFSIRKNNFQTRNQAKDANRSRVDRKTSLTGQQMREAKKLLIKKKKLQNARHQLEEENKKYKRNKSVQEQEIKSIEVNLKEISDLEKVSDDALSRLKSSYEALTNKIVQLKNLSRELTEKTTEEEERQRSSSQGEIAEQARSRYEQLRGNILESHRRLTNAVPLLIFLNQARGVNGSDVIQPLLEMIMNTLGRYNSASTIFGNAMRNKKGLTQAQIDKIEDLIYSKHTEKKNQTFESCPICYIDYKVGDKLKKLPCEHVFHTPCIEEWLKKKAKCPMCNHEIKPGDLN